jgi:hypothetical protein
MLGWSLHLSKILNNPGLLKIIFSELPAEMTSFVLASRLVNQQLNNNQLYENINSLELLISMLALASRLDALDYENNYFDQISVVANQNVANISLKDVLTYTFTVGEDLLGFYLLFWELTLK